MASDNGSGRFVDGEESPSFAEFVGVVLLFVAFFDAYPTPKFVKLDGVKREVFHSSVEYLGSLAKF